jgi:hypothetical protein
MGREPPTFCVANARCRSGPFASVRSNQVFAGLRNTTEPERTPNVAILATESVLLLTAGWNQAGVFSGSDGASAGSSEGSSGAGASRGTGSSSGSTV